jgi:hypothetical protein
MRLPIVCLYRGSTVCTDRGPRHVYFTPAEEVTGGRRVRRVPGIVRDGYLGMVPGNGRGGTVEARE